MVIYIIITGGNYYDIQQSFKKIAKNEVILGIISMIG